MDIEQNIKKSDDSNNSVYPAVASHVNSENQSSTNKDQYVSESSTIDEIITSSDSHSLVLQFLTYSFWGLVLFSLSTLTVSTLQYYLNKTSLLSSMSGNSFSFGLFFSNDLTTYLNQFSIGLLVVLVPITVVLDYLYRKREPVKKKGASAVFMIIFSIIFAFLSISSLISLGYVSVIMISSILNGGDVSSLQVSLYSNTIIAALYALAFLRAFAPENLFEIRQKYSIIMSIAAGVLIIANISAIAAAQDSAKKDYLIEKNIYSVNKAIVDYYKSNKNLPDSLDKINVDSNAKKIITDKLVSYKNEGKASKKSSLYSYTTTSSNYYRYQLCAKYQKESIGYNKEQTSSNSNYDYYSGSDDGYQSAEYSSGYFSKPHPAGEYCYKMQILSSN